MDITREDKHLKNFLEKEGFILNSYNQKEAVFQKENFQIVLTYLNCCLYDID